MNATTENILPDLTPFVGLLLISDANSNILVSTNENI